MKLLFDENLSPKLPYLLVTLFPNSAHVRECGLLGLTDEEVWEYARISGFTDCLEGLRTDPFEPLLVLS